MAPDPVGCCNNGRSQVQLPRKAVNTTQLSAEQQEIVRVGTAVAQSVIRSHISGRQEAELRTARRMIELVDEIKPQTTLVFGHLCSELPLTTHNARTVFFEVTRELFHDDVNFGRIVTLYAFAGKMAQHFAVSGNGDMTQRIISWVSLLVEKHCQWLQRHGGWDGFEKHFDGHRSRWTIATKGFILAAVGLGVAGCLFIKMKWLQLIPGLWLKKYSNNNLLSKFLSGRFIIG